MKICPSYWLKQINKQANKCLLANSQTGNIGGNFGEFLEEERQRRSHSQIQRKQDENAILRKGTKLHD